MPTRNENGRFCGSAIVVATVNRSSTLVPSNQTLKKPVLLLCQLAWITTVCHWSLVTVAMLLNVVMRWLHTVPDFTACSVGCP